MTPNKSLTRAAYLLGTLLILLPLFDTTMSVWPLRLGDERWRFGAVGTLSFVLLSPLLGLSIVMAVAVLLDHRRVQRFVGYFCIAAAIVLAVLDVLFILDFFQARATVRPQFQTAILIQASTAFIKHVAGIAVLVLLGRAGFSGPKPAKRKIVSRSPDEPMRSRVPAGADTTLE